MNKPVGVDDFTRPNVLGDRFASLPIAPDKPFVASEDVVTATKTRTGIFKHVGLMTTRVQSITVKELVCSIADLLICLPHQL